MSTTVDGSPELELIVAASEGAGVPQWITPALLIAHAGVLASDSNVLRVGMVGLDGYVLKYFLGLKPAGPFLKSWVNSMTLFRTLAVCFNFVAIRDRHRDYVRIGKNEGYAFATTKPFGRRFLDALQMIASTRGIGWAWQPKALPTAPPADYSRLKFITDNVVNILWRVLFLDIKRSYFLRTSYLTCTSLLDQPLWKILLDGTMIIYESKCTIEIPYLIASSLGVLIGWGTPADWPPMFDSVTNAWTNRRFWSQYWHQQLRAIAEPQVQFVLHGIMKVRRGTYLSNYGKVFGNFFMAIVVHGVPRVVAGGSSKVDWYFYTAQALAIWFEETIRDVAIAAGFPKDHKLGRIIGYASTALFQCLSWTYYGNPLYQLGAYGDPVFGFSMVEPVLGMLGWK